MTDSELARANILLAYLGELRALNESGVFSTREIEDVKEQLNRLIR